MAFELPERPELPEPASLPSLRELSNEVQKKIDLHRSSKDSSLRSPPIAVVPEPAHYTTQTLLDPIAAVEICPAYPEYMIIGTYALLKPDEQGVSAGQVRTGSISVLSLAASFKPSYPGAIAPLLDEKCLNAAVLDIHFHPSDHTLLGVATSDAKITFFRLIKRASVLARRVEMQLDHLGSLSVAEANEHREVPLITSFCWLPSLMTDTAGSHTYHHVSLAATVSNGDVKIVRALTPADALDDRVAHLRSGARVLESENLVKHNEEAWTVASTTIPAMVSASDSISRILTLSGGDDSALIATSVDPNPTLTIVSADPAGEGFIPFPFRDHSTIQPSTQDLSPATLLTSPSLHLWTDRKTHTAGVIAILPLSPHQPSTTIPILTGSYDEHIRLFLLDTTSSTLKRSLILEKKLGGGVWRLKLMHESTVANGTKYWALILASCMHGGVRVLRLTYAHPTSSSPAASGASSWHLTVLQKFTKGHESMNYGSDFRAGRDEEGKRTGEYTIVSTSFYDKVVCVWKFMDEDERQ